MTGGSWCHDGNDRILIMWGYSGWQDMKWWVLVVHANMWGDAQFRSSTPLPVTLSSSFLPCFLLPRGITRLILCFCEWCMVLESRLLALDYSLLPNNHYGLFRLWPLQPEPYDAMQLQASMEPDYRAKIRGGLSGKLPGTGDGWIRRTRHVVYVF
jgi:hypothetical protein